MKLKGEWIAKKLEGTQYGNTVSEEFDTDKHPITASLGNEDGQNKIDATLVGKKGKVSIRNVKCDNSNFFKNYFVDLKNHLKHSSDGFNEKIDENKTDFLIIEDFNTYGLTGNLEKKTQGDRYSHFFLSFSPSKSGKDLGRRGQGRNVYWIASYIKSFFGYSIQSDTNKKLLRGLCYAGDTTIGEDDYNPYVAYTVPHKGNENIQNRKETLPVLDEKEIDEFIKLTGIKRKNEPGLSLVIPYPHERIKINGLKNQYLKRFWAAILFEAIELEVQDNLINEKNIRSQCKSIGITENYVDFIEGSRTLPEENYILIDFSNREDLPSGLDIDLIGQDKIEKIKRDYYTEEIISFRIKLKIPYKTKKHETSFFNFHLKRGESDKGTTGMPALFMRGFLQLSEMSRRFKYSSKGLAFLWCDDEHISTFLGDSEGKAHLSWDSNHKDIENNYDEKKAKKIFELINNCLNDAYKIITSTQDEIDYDTFSNFIPKVKSGVTEEKEDKKLIEDFDFSKKSTKIKITTKKRNKNKSAKKMVEDSKIEGGFRILKMTTTEKKDFPMMVRSTCAYNVRRGNPFKAYNPERHFEIGDGKVKVSKQTKIKNLKILDGNRIEFIALEEDFELEVTGFDINRKDIYVKTRKLKDNSEILKSKNG